jgi:general secretion pathway protein G
MKIHRILRAARRSRRGFSLAELMVVIVIIGLLATLVVPALLQRLGQAFEGKVKGDLVQIESALTQYAINNKMQYPDTLQALIDLDASGKKYLNAEKIPQDPWGHEYGYEPPTSNHPNPLVFSYGKDGSPGGQGDDRDLTNDMLHNNEF